VSFTQWLQLTIQRRIISRVLESQQRPKPPLFFKLFGIFPVLRRIPARLIGIGIRPEHVRTPEAAPDDYASATTSPTPFRSQKRAM